MFLTFGQSARDADNIAAAPSRLLNCYREPTAEGGMTLRPAPGQALAYNLGGAFVRAMQEIDGDLHAVGAGRLWRLGATAVDLGAIPGGDTCLSGNNGDVTVTAAGRYFVWDGTTLTEPTAGAFSAFGAHDYIGNYTVLTEAGGRRFQWSDIADASTLPGLNFSTADGRDDLLVRPLAIDGALWLWKQHSHEVWYLTGQAGAAAFERLAGGVKDIGLKAFGLVCRFPGGVFLIGDDGRAHIAGIPLRPVSTPAVETAIEQGDLLACVAYEDEGHTICAITFADRPAWCYDLATGEWHERAEGLSLMRWEVTATAKGAGTWYAGRNDGRITRLEQRDDDVGVPVIREATTRAAESADGERFTVWELEAYPRRGFVAGSISLSMSRDGGVTWGAEKARPYGPAGNTAGRVVWRNLGRFRRASARLRWDTAIAIDARLRVRT